MVALRSGYDSSAGDEGDLVDENEGHRCCQGSSRSREPEKIVLDSFPLDRRMLLVDRAATEATANG